MLDSIRIENFKIFRDFHLELRPLTVLTGFNSAGKSTVMQAILLANLACKSSAVPLNGPYGLTLGGAFDVLNRRASEPEIRFTLVTRALEELIRLTVPDDDRAVLLSARTSSRDAGREPLILGIDAYLSAERLGPRDLLEVPPSHDGGIDIGERGQFTAHVLAERERMKVNSQLLHPGTRAAITLSGQVEAWLSDLVRPIRVQATWLPATNAAMIRFRDAPASSEASPDLVETEVPADWMRPSNVGFGLSYALPIVVAGLTARPNSIFMVENPEAHLHPAGQSKIGHFLALVASSGVQTIVETHSEHVVNGIRLAIAKHRNIAPELAVFHFFGDSPSMLSVSSTGAMSDWPLGFFDQAETDLSALARIKRSS